MNEDTFWALVEEARTQAKGRDAALPDALSAILRERKPDEIVAFQVAFEARMREANLAPLWNAAHLMNKGTSEESFEHFRGWLIGQGRAVYEGARVDADRLADVDVKRGKALLDDLLFAAGTAYNERTGATDFFDRIPKEDQALEGLPFTREEELKEKLPRLYAKFGK
ncbi:MAG: DUF4240 domain-containing protein [Polyangiaceae bacterium]|nr:DUF4240 domain-containing protein [Polyangiaceae bacterium]